MISLYNGLEEFDTRGIFMVRRTQKAVNMLLARLPKCFAGKRLGHIAKKTSLTLSYKGMEVVESSDCLRPYGSRHIEEQGEFSALSMKKLMLKCK